MLKKVIFALILIALYQASRGSDKAISYVSKSVKSMISNCIMDYQTELTMPDGKIQKASGVMAFLGRNFYDSSNTRFIFLNDSWFIGADHDTKTIKVFDMRAWRKAFGNLGSLNLFEFLINEDSTYLNKAKLKVEMLKDDKYLVRIQMDGKEDLIKSLEFIFNLKTGIPLQYSGLIKVPIEFETKYNSQYGVEEDIPIQFAQVKFSCTAIRRVSPDFFNHDRLILEQGGKAKILRYQNYETIYTKKTK